MTSTIAVTPGEPAGIGPDLCIQYAAQHYAGTEQLVLIADPLLLENRARQLNINIDIVDTSQQKAVSGAVNVMPVSLAAPCNAGKLNPANSAYVLETLNRAVTGCMSGEFQAMVTGPVQKSVINDAGIPFSGHTEYLAEKCACENVVMMLATTGLKVALATTHLPLAKVAAAITPYELEKTITILDRDLREKFAISKPRILVAGLNPHAGESGYFGNEEVETIIPVLESCRQSGIDLTGPLPADTLFTPKYLDHADAVLAMYHDQGLPVLKYKGFGNAVNITLGLPIIRTSVDHGTALDLAGTGSADYGSLQSAITLAREMSAHWKQHGV